MSNDRAAIIRAAFREQASLCRQLDSAFTADILDTVAATLDETTRTGQTILNWPGDALVDALALRLTGGLHALARSKEDAELTRLYDSRKGDLRAILARVVMQWDDWLAPWLASAPQTNEVGRSAVLWPGVLQVARLFGPKVELLELGASAGLNLNMDCYGYELGGVRAGEEDSPVQMKPAWTGPSPDNAAVQVVRRSGCDLNPINVSKPDVAARLLAYVWPDQGARLARIEAALTMAQSRPPLVEKADGADWIDKMLSEPQEEGITRLVYHSIALQYFPSAGRKRVIDAIKRAGETATVKRPLAWLSMEFAAEVKDQAILRLLCWPGDGNPRTLATVHPHGAAVNWVGETD